MAFGLVVAAGLSTTIGSTFVFCSSYANTKILAGALGVSAGVMLYVSFVEIFAIKSVEGFSAAYGDRGSTYATLCFFGGILATTLLDAAVHAIGRYQRDARCDDGASDGGERRRVRPRRRARRVRRRRDAAHPHARPHVNESQVWG